MPVSQQEAIEELNRRGISIPSDVSQVTRDDAIAELDRRGIETASPAALEGQFEVAQEFNVSPDALLRGLDNFNLDIPVRKEEAIEELTRRGIDIRSINRRFVSTDVRRPTPSPGFQEENIIDTEAISRFFDRATGEIRPFDPEAGIAGNIGRGIQNLETGAARALPFCRSTT